MPTSQLRWRRAALVVARTDPGPPVAPLVTTGPAVVLAAVLQRNGDGDAASQRLTWVIIGLLVLAVVLLVATVLFWRATRPDHAAEPPAARPGPTGDAN